MKGIRSALIFGAVLLLPVLWMWFWVGYLLDAASHNHGQTSFGVVMVFPGALIIAVVLGAMAGLIQPDPRHSAKKLFPAIAWLLAWLVASGIYIFFLASHGRAESHAHALSSSILFWGTLIALAAWFGVLYRKGRQVRAAVFRPPRTLREARLRKRNLERDLRRLRWMRRNPGAVFAFLAGALVILSCFCFIPAYATSAENLAVLHAIGIVFGSAYLIWLVALLKTLVAGQWHEYIDEHTLRTEEHLSRIESALERLAG